MNTFFTIRKNEDGSETITNAIVVDADELLKHTDQMPEGIGIGWTVDTTGIWNAPKKQEEETTNE